MCGQRLSELGNLVLPIEVPCIQPGMLANVHGRQKPEQQQMRQGHGVALPASSMDIGAAQREESRKDRRDKRVSRDIGNTGVRVEAASSHAASSTRAARSCME